MRAGWFKDLTKRHRTSDNGRFAKSAVRSPKSFREMSCNGRYARCISTSGNEGGGGGICAARGRSTARLRARIRGIEIDVASSPLHAVNLLFKVLCLCMKVGRYYSKYLLDLSIPNGGNCKTPEYISRQVRKVRKILYRGGADRVQGLSVWREGHEGREGRERRGLAAARRDASPHCVRSGGCAPGR